jgi:hypothetical protein
VFGYRHVIVMVSVTEETPYLSGLLAGVTVMTLMTVNRRRILDARFVFHPRWLSSIIY